MTRDDAIKEIDNLRNDIGSAYDDADQSPMWYALGMAIEALGAQKIAEWHVFTDCEGKMTHYTCPFCNRSSAHFAWKPKYCDYCGARLTIPEEAADDLCDEDCEHCDRVRCPEWEEATDEP